ncbi:ImmA/IrrE family metallo-endopeptidase [Clostridium sardiniense]|uniref:ImmA/IrrE family metallo-endopeptidase n=1 Tax=Clostridium sardiniense TaxID=29369 RepID=A0ABS7L268_CLOSR|nr:ImmA/IrrE family metallo-endopeptidase [Clostridium sardiniense]MBY0756948.1 ImmA/IrrE family metallo-endopeptidase [Clostridium sardiniense]MBY0756972.1 ImmA/IrrE family metallo-endopeptidase [Clostridium sardiniense]MDQ0460369.1 Zn-dependent peptidase ImmA (M78 family) [Clostridium sardiniense]
MELTRYEELLDETYSYGIKVIETNLGGDCGYCYDETIYINEYSTETTKFCILSEELGHYFTTTGDITYLNSSNIYQENRARYWSYSKIISPESIITCILNGAISIQDLTSELSVSEDFLLEAIDFYKRKYGVYYVGKTHLLTFSPLNIIPY